ncbi:MAG TPA: HAMP domain-containing sensor histidine kinase [Balneolaceae bacterium]|nr:HAMP domain-containing sensor histidine kinase [Balneolaceae bacterium]
MKLITRFIIIYLTITVIVLGIGGVISYELIKTEVDKELQFEFMERIDRVAYLIERGRDFHRSRRGREIEGDQNLIIERLDYEVEPRIEVKDTLIWHDRLEQNESNVKVSAYRNINGESYYISTYGAMIESDDITEAVVKTFLWILGLQILGAIGIGYFVSGPLFKPFRESLKKIKRFKLQEKQYIPAEETGVVEFNEMNAFVEEMTRKAVSDYENLKEFAENASHEIQTPLAIARGKLELLSETELNEEQYSYVDSLERTVKKLSRLSESLALLTKIDNHEFDNGKTVNISEFIEESISQFSEFLALRNLSLETSVEENVEVYIHPVLADILWTNLFQNAIKHNIDGGTIKIKLTREKLSISNTGRKPTVDPDKLFERFQKADQSSDSIGLGLSIIKRIVEQNDYTIAYSYSDGWHTIEILLNGVKGNQLQN